MESLSFRDRLASAIKEGGKEIERAIQFAAGAVILTIIGTLPSTWGVISDPTSGLRLTLIGVLAGFCTTFALALSATATRVIYFYEKAVPRSWQRTAIFSWSFIIFAAVAGLALSGSLLLSGLLRETEKEIAAAEGLHSVPEETGWFFVGKYQELQKRRDALIRVCVGETCGERKIAFPTSH
jgi:hypothetical protein